MTTRVPYRMISRELPTEFRRAGEQIDRNFAELEGLAGGGGGVPVIDLGDSPVYVGFTRGFWIGATAKTLTAVIATLDTPGSADITAGIYVDGTFQESLTLPAGDTFLRHECSIDFPADSLWQMYQQATVADAVGLTYYGEFE